MAVYTIFGRNMNKSDRKMAVRSALQRHGGQVNLPALIVLLENKFPERSVRRWLHELIEEGLIGKIGQKKGTRYQAIPFDEVAKASFGSLFSDISLQAITYVKQPIYLREPTTYHFDWLESYEPNQTFYLTQSQREFLKNQGERHYQHDAAGTYARHIYNRLIIDLSYNSSRLEGNTYSLLETERLVIKGDVQADKLNDEAVMILNHKEAIRYLIENIAKLTIDQQVICTLHYLLADGLLPTNECGLLRNHGVKIGGSIYLPLENKSKLEINLSAICKKAARIQNPYEQSIFLLIHIAYLQAFQDCNKRTSRLSANFPLIRENLVPMSFNDVPKEDYANAMLSVYELNNIHPLVDLYMFSYSRTCKQYDVSIESLGFDRIKIQYRQQRREILKGIISQKLTNESMMYYIQEHAALLVPKADQEQFKTAILEEIHVLSIGHIKGMGISPEDFYAWKYIKEQKN